MNIEDIKKKFEVEMKLVEDFIVKSLYSNIDLIGNVGEYVILYGGKRVRPLIVMLFSKIFSSDHDKTISMAGAIELIHTATLLHDDVVDLSDKRRGKITVNNLWGNKEAILVGDFLYTRAFQMMVNVDNLNILKLMADTTNIMSEGEVYQLVNRSNFDIKESDCLNIIKCKTAQLFAASASVSPILSNLQDELKIAAFNYGMYLGIAYQLVDDFLDYSTDDVRFGKNIATDIKSSTFTLPLIYFMNESNSNKIFVKNILSRDFTSDDVLDIRNNVLKSNALNYTFNLASDYADLAKKAILSIPESKYTHLALSLIDFVLNRKY
ncbi:polyprenyl synthetase family protein [Candidatus Azoamicus ciliaticola]|uniref:Octaprenyl diphosphate synthase n=1 Tax=Candidatus Azoamicus ciliaticola TaxID=2652803 RepID=A0A6J5JZV3_9GAMM|nr:polyprenyl synthetase family protein [Candidatus Azoamicus ciliaticola]CAB3976497.1 Octaprenyl diphosphate synthase [Candidatus Azoamicus ciliaticola]